jgi:hypothetical protein
VRRARAAAEREAAQRVAGWQAQSADRGQQHTASSSAAHPGIVQRGRVRSPCVTRERSARGFVATHSALTRRPSLGPHSPSLAPHSLPTHSGSASLQGHAAWPLKRTLRRAALQWHSTRPLEYVLTKCCTREARPSATSATLLCVLYWRGTASGRCSGTCPVLHCKWYL